MTTPMLNSAVGAIAGQIRELASRVQTLERNQRSSYNISNTSLPGSLIITDPASGDPVVVVGQQSDGTFTAKQVGTVVSPKAPDTPLVTPGIEGLYVAWDGLMSDGSTPQADFAAVQIHVSTVSGFTPSAATLQGHIVGAGLFGVGSLSPGTTYYVQLVAINGVGDSGPPSAQSSGVPAAVPAGVIPPGSITALQIQTGTITAAQIAAAANILGSQIASGTITSANILAGTITAALLAAGLVVAGIVDATTITGSTLRNSASNPMTAINPDGSLTITNAGGTVIFKVGPDGTLYWFSPGGTLMMELQPGGNQLIYASLTGPSGWDFEPPGPPALLFSLSSATSSATYANAPAVPVTQGSVVTVVASASGSTSVTGVTDSQGNTYTQTQAVTSGVWMSAWQAVNVTALGTSDSITVTYGAANTQEKNFIALATAGVVTASVTDFSSSASGTSTSPSTSGTPANYGDLLLFCMSNASAGGIPSAISDGWTQLAQQQIGGNQNTSVWYSANISGGSQSATATIASAAWSAIMIGLKASPLNPASSGSPAGVLATLSQSTAWTGDGVLSLKITHSGTTTGWGATFPAFAVQPGTTVSMQATIFTPTALSAISIGFTFWSGAGGTGTNLGSVSGDQGTLSTSANGIYLVSITGASVPAGAVSVVFFISEGAADASGTAYYIDVIQVPGGLVYSNSPTGGTDSLGNTFEQGINFVGLPGLTSVLGVEDPYGNTLAGIDGMGNISGQVISAAQDIVVGGQSLGNSLLPGFAEGIVNRGWCPATGTTFPWPTQFGSTEVALAELDQVLTAGRIYKWSMSQVAFSVQSATSFPFRAFLEVRYTTDGTTPTTSSTLLCQATTIVYTGIGSNFCSFPSEEFLIVPSATATYRFLVCGKTNGSTDLIYMEDYLYFHVEDIGDANAANSGNNATVLGTGSSGSGSKQTYTKTYYATATYSYYGSEVGQGRRDSNSTMLQGCASGDLHTTGDQYSFAVFPYSQINSDLSGAAINQVQLRLYCQHSWYDNGMFVVLGYSGITSFGGVGNISGGVATQNAMSYKIGEGQVLTKDVTAVLSGVVGTAGFTSVLLGPSKSTSGGATDLYNYGYFFGYSPTDTQHCPALEITYTK